MGSPNGHQQSRKTQPALHRQQMGGECVEQGRRRTPELVLDLSAVTYACPSFRASLHDDETADVVLSDQGSQLIQLTALRQADATHTREAVVDAQPTAPG